VKTITTIVDVVTFSFYIEPRAATMGPIKITVRTLFGGGGCSLTEKATASGMGASIDAPLSRRALKP
jgi:hypothetical protein